VEFRLNRGSIRRKERTQEFHGDFSAHPIALKPANQRGNVSLSRGRIKFSGIAAKLKYLTFCTIRKMSTLRFLFRFDECKRRDTAAALSFIKFLHD